MSLLVFILNHGGVREEQPAEKIISDSKCHFWCVAFQWAKLHIQMMKKTLRHQFGMKVKELRVASGISQEAFADRCGFARSYLSRIERGGSNASLDAIEVLAQALEVQPWQLLTSSDPAHAQSEKDADELVVPYAADGTCFHPGLASSRDGSYGVGDKHAQKRFGTFSEALEYLRSMETAKWRRPNSSGNWGIVSAVRWDKMNK